jgi:hypothetical protein
VGSTFGVLCALGGGALPGVERVIAAGNAFGRGPLVFLAPQSLVDRVLALAADEAEGQQARQAEAAGRGGRQGGAAAVSLALHRTAAADVVECVEEGVHAAVRSHLLAARPLPALDSAGSGGGAPAGVPGREAQLAERTVRYTAQGGRGGARGRDRAGGRGLPPALPCLRGGRQPPVEGDSLGGGQIPFPRRPRAPPAALLDALQC